MKENNICEFGSFVDREKVSEVVSEGVCFESEGEFTLPEYMPEISKVLSCSARIVSSGKFVGSDNVEFSGNIVYTLYYVGEGGQTCASALYGEYEYPYTSSVLSNVGTEILDICDRANIESVSARPSGPRKVVMRSKIKACPRMTYRGKESELVFEGEEYEKLTEIRPGSRTVSFDSGEFELEHRFRLDASSDAEALACEGTLLVSDVKVNDGGVFCRGELWATVVYRDVEAGRYVMSSVIKKLPFEKNIPLSEAVSAATANGKTVSVEVTDDEESGEIVVRSLVSVTGRGICEQKLSYLTDAYKCGAESMLEYKDVENVSSAFCKNANYSYRTEKKLTGEAIGSMGVCPLGASARIDNFDTNGKNAKICGEITLAATLVKRVEGGCEYYPQTLSVPFKVECDMKCAADKYRTEIIPDVVFTGARCDGETLVCDAELYLSVNVESVSTVRVVKRMSGTNKDTGNGRDSIVLYYPDSDESLWSVCKKYAVPIDRVTNINHFSESMGSFDAVAPHSPVMIKCI